ncbi:hypothetical protein BN871_CQ_00120 [Paenibacillus sp. P22]|nr:hypothetical protein BN871_CQ_00120 [Paenibacillus sp. P22]
MAAAASRENQAEHDRSGERDAGCTVSLHLLCPSPWLLSPSLSLSSPYTLRLHTLSSLKYSLAPLTPNDAQ